jgi:hypothetical protein
VTVGGVTHESFSIGTLSNIRMPQLELIMTHTLTSISQLLPSRTPHSARLSSNLPRKQHHIDPSLSHDEISEVLVVCGRTVSARLSRLGRVDRGPSDSGTRPTLNASQQIIVRVYFITAEASSHQVKHLLEVVALGAREGVYQSIGASFYLDVAGDCGTFENSEIQYIYEDFPWSSILPHCPIFYRLNIIAIEFEIY